MQPFVIEREFAGVSRRRLWQAWSEAAQLQRWWGPKGCRIGVEQFDFRPGGFFHYAMHFGAAPPMWGRFLYREITASDRIVWLNSFANARCGIARAPFSDACPLEIENVATFSEHAGTARVLLQARPFGAEDDEVAYFADLRPSLEQGYGGTFEQLAAHLGSLGAERD